MTTCIQTTVSSSRENGCCNITGLLLLADPVLHAPLLGLVPSLSGGYSSSSICSFSGFPGLSVSVSASETWPQDLQLPRAWLQQGLNSFLRLHWRAGHLHTDNGMLSLPFSLFTGEKAVLFESEFQDFFTDGLCGIVPLWGPYPP